MNDGLRDAAEAAYEISRVAACEGFDWSDTASVWQKIREEWRELSSPGANIAEEYGDLLFTQVNLCRKAGLTIESAFPHTAICDSETNAIEMLSAAFEDIVELYGLRGVVERSGRIIATLNLGLEPTRCLLDAVNKFRRRYDAMKLSAAEAWNDATQEFRDNLWNEVKKQENECE